MKAKYFGARPSRNVYKGGQQLSLDEYNKSFKGDAFNTEYKKKHYPDSMGYMSRGIKEYNRYPETKDTTKDNDEKEAASAAAVGAALLRKTGGRSRQRLFQQAIALVVGSIMIATSYQAMVAARDNSDIDEPTVSATAADDNGGNSGDSGDSGFANSDNENHTEETTASETEETTSPVDSPSDQQNAGNSLFNNANSSDTSSDDGTNDDNTNSDNADSNDSNSNDDDSDSDKSVSVSWKWSDDYKSATLIVKDSSGDVTDKVKADITKTKKKATCTKKGKITYTAKATANGKTYTDKKSKKTSALGHKFGSGKEITLDDGNTAMEFICKRCNEHFTIQNSLDEE